ncbi:hypothetical protein EVAR_42785_1 [Eumeta japonica]|uniref:Uncharacterized protein n=1 Tax=Eumeta variegata TaxID=151549 RepID=A0A4C1WK20_EUMVA|nr:hypothetical protein EVAR_42785_1 [Eumeta japonica]
MTHIPSCYYHCINLSILCSPTLSHSSTNPPAIHDGLSRIPRPRRYTIIKRIRGKGGGHSKDIEVLQLTVYAGYAVVAFLSSFAISLAFEAPAVRLLKLISGGDTKS